MKHLVNANRDENDVTNHCNLLSQPSTDFPLFFRDFDDNLTRLLFPIGLTNPGGIACLASSAGFFF